MPNTLSAVMPKLLAQGLVALRSSCVMPRLVNRALEPLAGAKGSTIDVPIPSAITAVAVTPANTAPVTADVSPTVVTVPLDQWYEAPFYMTDKDMLEVMAGTIPMQASEAIKALANNINAYILGFYKDVYGYAGTAGTTPFASDLTALTAARKVLGNQLAPMGDRRLVLNMDAEANALGQRAIQDASWRGNAAGIVEGMIGRTLGFDIFSDQQMPTHTAGTASGATTNTAGYAIGVSAVTLASAGTGTILVGDVFTFANHTQTYTCTAGDADVSGGGTLSFSPPLVAALPTSAQAITLKASHAINLAFQRDWLSFASRPFADADASGMGRFIPAVDPVSGLAIRLEVTREHKRTRWSFDALYGAKVTRKEFAARIAG